MGWIAAVEAAYGIDSDEDAWLSGVLASLSPELDRGYGVVAQVFRLDGPGLALQRTVTHGGGPDLMTQVEAMSALAPPEVGQMLLRPGRVGSFRALLEPLGLGEMFSEELARCGGGARDSVIITVHDAEDGIILVSGARPAPGPVSHPHHLQRTASHVGSGLRLRRRLERLGDAHVPEGVLTPDGDLAHAEGPATTAREVLSRAVRARERARSELRHRDADEALSLWRALVRGRWSLVDQIDSDGRRYVVAHQNDPRVRDPRGLSPTEARVGEALGKGQAPKEIAYDLGVSASAVRKAAARGRRKLGLDSLAQLAAFFAPGGPRDRMETHSIGGETLAVAALEPSEESLRDLTPAEQDVARRIARGETNAEIALGRGTSQRTVANQVCSLFERMGVRSRAQLAQRLMRD